MAQAGVLDYHQKETDKPRIYRKLSLCKKLVSRGVAYWVRKGAVVRLLAPHEIKARLLAAQVLRTPWESVEIPGLRFEPPNIRHNPDASILRMAGNSKPSLLGIDESEIEAPITHQERERMFAEYAAAI